MAEAPEHLRGVIHGRTIELDQEPGLAEGEVVFVTVRPALPPGEGLRQSAGAWAGDSEQVDAWLAEMRASRHRDRGTAGQ
jgi:hypothetical protein